MGFLKASKVYGVPKSTLERRVKDKNLVIKGAEKGLRSRQLTFSPAMEEQLVNYVKKMEAMFYGLTTQEIKCLAYQLAEKNGIPHHFSQETKMAGKVWLQSFIQRNRLAIRVPEPTSAARARAFNKHNVDSFFNLLEGLQEQFSFPPSKIYNVDETGISNVPNHVSKVIALKGKKQVGALSSAERGELHTITMCVNAIGNYIPPMIIFPRVRMKDELLYGAPPETLPVCHKSGWMQSDLFVTWFEHFITYAHPSEEHPVLLILDGHASHTKNIALIDMARENNVSILCLPPHCTHRLQPLDVSVMGPLSSYYGDEAKKWLRNHPSKVISTYNIAYIFGAACLRAATPQNAIKGFEKCGIYPLDRDVFQENDFLPAEPTDLPPPIEDHLTPEPVEHPINDSSLQIINQPNQVSNTLDHMPPSGVDNIEPPFIESEEVEPTPSTSKDLKYCYYNEVFL